MATKSANKLYYANVRFRGFVGEHFKTILWISGLIIAAIGFLASVLQIVGGSAESYFTVVGHAVATGVGYLGQYFFADPRAIVVWVAIVVLTLEINFQKGEKRFRQFALERKGELAKQLRVIAKPGELPRNHYLALIIGGMGSKARKIQRTRARDIISAIDKNIKKNEAVYWISVSEIGIVMYEDRAKKEPTDFVNAILKRKLRIELGEEDANAFLEDTTFAWVPIEQHDELDDIELRARNELKRKLETQRIVQLLSKPEDITSIPSV
jgi:hypothetical protein